MMIQYKPDPESICVGREVGAAGVVPSVVVGAGGLIVSTGTAMELFGLMEMKLLNNLFNSSFKPADATCFD